MCRAKSFIEKLMAVLSGIVKSTLSLTDIEKERRIRSKRMRKAKADVLVVGSGGAGLRAALSAKKLIKA